MKIIFLDFDGTMISDWTPPHSGIRAVAHPVCIQALNRITRRTGAKIVVSSAWRIGKSLIWLRKKLREWRVKGQIIGITPHFAYMGRLVNLSREDEIKAWLKAHPNIDRFVILDDGEVGYPDRHIKTHPALGLTMEQAERAIQILGAKEHHARTRFRERPQLSKVGLCTGR